jgi:manganese/zinc/iron transport system permease protein
MKNRTPLLILAAILIAEAVLFSLVGKGAVQAGFQAIGSVVGIPYNTLLVLLGTGLLGLASGVIGSFAVLRRRSLIGDAVAHASLPGLGIAFLLMGGRNFVGLILGATISGLIGTVLITWLQKNTRIKADAAIGIVLSTFYGLGIVLSRIIQDDPTGRQAGLDSFLLGKTAGMVSQDVMMIALVAANVLMLTAFLYKEFKLLSFDPGFATVQGWPVLMLDIVLLGLLVVTVVIGLPAVGVVLMAAMVILPGVSARFWTDRLGVMLVLAGIFGLSTGVMGTVASSRWPELPAGAVIVLSGALIFLLSMFVAPRRGIVGRAIQAIRFRWRVSRQNLLRTLYETLEKNPDDVVTFEQVMTARSWSPWQARRLLRTAVWRNQVESTIPNQWRLTEKGYAEAAQVVRSHRLWELFLVQQASIASDHVDRDADEIEHVLTPSILTELENQLKQDQRWPSSELPNSVHPLDEAAEGSRG